MLGNILVESEGQHDTRNTESVGELVGKRNLSRGPAPRWAGVRHPTGHPCVAGLAGGADDHLLRLSGL